MKLAYLRSLHITIVSHIGVGDIAVGDKCAAQ